MRLPGASDSSERHFGMSLILIPFWQNSIYLFLSKCMWPSQHSSEILRSESHPSTLKIYDSIWRLLLSKVFPGLYEQLLNTKQWWTTSVCIHSLGKTANKLIHSAQITVSERALPQAPGTAQWTENNELEVYWSSFGVNQIALEKYRYIQGQQLT